MFIIQWIQVELASRMLSKELSIPKKRAKEIIRMYKRGDFNGNG